MSVGPIAIATLALLALGLAWVVYRLSPSKRSSAEAPVPRQSADPVDHSWTFALVVSAAAESAVERLRRERTFSAQSLSDLAPHVEFVARRASSAPPDAFFSGPSADAPGEYDRFVVVFSAGKDVPALSATAASYARQEALAELVGRQCTVSERLAASAIENKDFFRF